MTGELVYSDQDRDALHILPLSIIPLETRSLKGARLIKNSRLEGMVELFTESGSGSGQIAPGALRQVFHFDRNDDRDLLIVQSLSKLPSYDVYSLRIELRRLGIDIDNDSDLTLSPQKSGELVDYMRVFTKPLIAAIYGGAQDEITDFKGLIKLFMRPDADRTRKKIASVCESLNISVQSLPSFLQDYGDTYLSLAFYQYCLDRNMPTLHEFFDALSELRRNPIFKSDQSTLKTMSSIKRKLETTQHEVHDVLEMFQLQTEDMWQSLSGEAFERMNRMIAEYQTKIGGALCAITVKMSAWRKMFPSSDQGMPQKRVQFILSEIRPGIEAIKSIKYSDALI